MGPETPPEATLPDPATAPNVRWMGLVGPDGTMVLRLDADGHSLLANGCRAVLNLSEADRLALAAFVAPEFVALLKEGAERLTCDHIPYTGEGVAYSTRVNALLARFPGE